MKKKSVVIWLYELHGESHKHDLLNYPSLAHEFNLVYLVGFDPSRAHEFTLVYLVGFDPSLAHEFTLVYLVGLTLGEHTSSLWFIWWGLTLREHTSSLWFIWWVWPLASTRVHSGLFGGVCVAHRVYFSVSCFLFLLCLSSFCVLCPILQVSLDCPFLIAHQGFPNSYLIKLIDKCITGYWRLSRVYFP